METRTHDGCGGTIALGGWEGYEHLCCERCGAFRYLDDPDEAFPTGADREANRRAWDDGETRSPDIGDADVIAECMRIAPEAWTS